MAVQKLKKRVLEIWNKWSRKSKASMMKYNVENFRLYLFAPKITEDNIS
jgi:hypothetical protein